MLKMIIADDKSFEREKLKSILDWQHFGVEIVGEAANGRNALELCLQHKPEVLITDIRMPVMNGIELTQALEGVLPEIRIIYLSSYDEFSYAQQAIKLNVRSYLLKPYSEKDIIDVLLRTLEEINESQRRRHQAENQSRLIQGNLSLLQQAFFRDMMNNPFDQQQFWAKASVLGLKFNSDSFLMLGIKATRASAPIFKRRQALSETLQAVLTACLPSYVDGFHILEEERQIYALLSIRDQCVEEAKTGIEEAENDIRRLLSNQHYVVRFHTSSIGYSPTSWRRLYWETTFHHAEDSVDVPADAERIYEKYQHVEPEIINSLVGLQTDYSDRLLDEVIGCVPSGFNAIHLTKVCLSFLCALRRIHREQQLLGQLQEETLTERAEEILTLSTAGDVLVWMKELLLLAEHQLKPYRKKRNAQIVDQVLDIIQSCYSDGIDVSGISSRVFISPNYLRSLFKERTGKSLSSYLSDYRIEKACQLLRDTSHKITDIPNLVGLVNSPYFFFLLKKSTGLTPGEYRMRYSRD